MLWVVLSHKEIGRDRRLVTKRAEGWRRVRARGGRERIILPCES